MDFLLTTASLIQVAAALCGDGEGAGGGRVGGGHVNGADALIAGIAAEGAELLEPYAGRAVINAGAVTFHGVVDDYVFRAYAALRGLRGGAQPDGGVPGSGVATRAAEAAGAPGGAGPVAASVVAGWHDRAASCYLRLGAPWWRDRLERGAAGSGARRPGAVAHLRRIGPGWIVGFDQATFSLPDLKGLCYLSELLGRPAADVAASQLAAAGAGHAGTVITGQGAGEIADARALAAYRQRLGDLDAELAEARSWADEGRMTRLQLEREALLAELRAAAGLGGRPRRFSSADERARVAVRKAIAAALARIEDGDPGLARLLRDTVRTGTRCRYDPDPARPVSWILET